MRSGFNVMDFNECAYWSCAIVTTTATIIYFTDKKLLSKNISPLGPNRASPVRNTDFIKFRRQFVFAYLTCIFADFLQQPYLYYLFQSYGYLQHQIAFLYVVYFISSILFEYVQVYLLQKLDRKVLCCCFPALSSVACILKFSSNYNLLVLSRIIDGCCLSLLAAPFQEWYAVEHLIDFDFPKEWIPETFRLIAIVSKYLAISSGFVAELVEDVFKVTLFPFLLAIPLFVAAGTWMCFKWSSSLPIDNRSEISAPTLITSAGPGYFSRLNSSFKLIYHNPNVLLLCVLQVFLETCHHVFNFLWTPIFAHLNRTYRVRPAFGGLYSTFAASALLGYTLQRMASNRKFSYCTLLTFAGGTVAFGALLTVSSSYPDHETKTRSKFTLYGLCLANTGLGMFMPAFQSAFKDLVPFEQRYHVSALFKTPAYLASALILAVTSLSAVFFNWLLILLCTLFAALSIMTSLALRGTVKRQQASAFDHVTFEVKGSESYDLQ